MVANLDPSLSLYDVRTLAQHVENNLGLRKIPARMFMVIGPLLLVLVAIGIYAVVSYAVAQRASEIGVRLAIGATGSRVVRDIVQDHMRIVPAGTVCGWLAACAAYLIVIGGPVDAVIFTAAPLLLLAVATAATWGPARLASAIDPVQALRGR